MNICNFLRNNFFNTLIYFTGDDVELITSKKHVQEKKKI